MTVREICERLDFPVEATSCILEMMALLSTRCDVPALFAPIVEKFLRADKAFLDELQRMAEEYGVNRYTLDMLFLLCAVPDLRQAYAERGIAEHILWDSMKDLRYKLMECYDNHGVWGTFVTFWYPGFYCCERFALGRLQYEKKRFSHPVYGDLLKEGDTVLNCHIPSSGPLTPVTVLDSLKRAYAFYPDVRIGDLMPVVCHSWLLYPPHRDLLGENAKAFYDLFDVIEEKVSESNGNFWRIFNMPYSAENLACAREDTSLRRRFKAFLTAGNKMGDGYGVLLFDGERVVKR